MTQLQQPSGCFCSNSEKQVGTAYILAGGQSRRLGQDKLFVRHKGRSLLSHTIEICTEVFDTVKIVAKSTEKFQSTSCEVVIDWPGADGPMAGIIAALQDCRDDCCFIVAADLPDLNKDVITTIINTYTDQQYAGLQEKDKPQLLCGIYHISALSVLTAQAKKGNYCMTDTLKDLSHTLIPVTSSTWRNVNRPSDLEKLDNTND